MQKTILNYGLVAGALISILMATSTSMFKDGTDFNDNMIFGIVIMLIALLVVFLAVYKFRKVDGGNYNYKRGLLVGLGVSFITSIIYVLTWEVVFNFYFPDFMEKYSAYCVKQLADTGASASVVASKQAEMANQTNMYQHTWYRMGLTFTEVFPLGLVASFIAPLIFRKRVNLNN